MNDKCPICLEDLRTNLGVIASCGHCLHTSCWDELKQSVTHNNDSIYGSSSNTKHPRCPICKHKAKRFVKMYLELTSNNKQQPSFQTDQSSSSSTTSTTSTINPVMMESEADQAVRCLSSENFRLKQKLRELESVSKDQSELLLEVLPKYDAMEHQAKLHTIEKAYLESKLEGIEAENAELISDWNLVEIKMQNLEGENQALQEENEILKNARDILAKRLVKITMRKNIRSNNDDKNVENKTSKMSHKRKRVEGLHSKATPTPPNLLNSNQNKTVVSKRREKRTRESIAHEYEMEKRNLKKLLMDANNETDKLKKRVEKLKRRVKKERRTRGLSM